MVDLNVKLKIEDLKKVIENRDLPEVPFLVSLTPLFMSQSRLQIYADRTGEDGEVFGEISGVTRDSELCDFLLTENDLKKLRNRLNRIDFGD